MTTTVNDNNINQSKFKLYKVGNYNVSVVNGKVISAVKIGDIFLKTLYPYRWRKECNAWSNESRCISIDALRAGMKRGTIIFK